MTTTNLLRRTFQLALLALAIALPALTRADPTTQTYAGREAIVYAPAHMPAAGSRALVVVLHGGMGSAQLISSRQAEGGLNLNAEADKDGFVVAYLNGTPVARFLGPRHLGWNAGHCCGLPAESKVDDVAYIQDAVGQIASQYGIDPHKIYGVGHSNGAMMTQRMMCETTLYAAAVAISGPLETDATTCPAAKGKRILAIHGANDQNVPMEGGKGSKGVSKVSFNSEAATAKVWMDSGAIYELTLVPEAGHATDDSEALPGG